MNSKFSCICLVFRFDTFFAFCSLTLCIFNLTVYMVLPFTIFCELRLCKVCIYVCILFNYDYLSQLDFIKLVYFICIVDILKCKFLPVPKQSGKHNTINESTGNACHMFQANSFQSNVLPHFNVYFCLAVIAADMQKQCRPGTVGEVGMWGIARLRILFCPSCNLLLIIIFLKME